MATKKSRPILPTLNTILKAVEGGFAAVAEDIADVKGDIAEIKSTMATKADVHAIVREEHAPIHAELKSIRDDLNDLIEKFENVSGYRKEIDHALDRIAAIERHLGITKKIAA